MGLTGGGEVDQDQTLSRFVGSLTRLGIVTMVVLALLGLFGVSTTSFAAVIGAAGLAIGLAFQGTLSNLAAGVMLLIFRPFKVGDVVTAGGVTGKVHTLGLMVTEIDTPTGRTREVLLAAIEKVEDKTLEGPAPAVVLASMGDSSVNWAVRVWVASGDFWGVTERLTEEIKLALDEAGIGIPYPQMDVHLDSVVANDKAA